MKLKWYSVDEVLPSHNKDIPCFVFTEDNKVFLVRWDIYEPAFVVLYNLTDKEHDTGNLYNAKSWAYVPVPELPDEDINK